MVTTTNSFGQETSKDDTNQLIKKKKKINLQFDKIIMEQRLLPEWKQYRRLCQQRRQPCVELAGPILEHNQTSKYE